MFEGKLKGIHKFVLQGSLIANMVMGMILLGKRYPLSKYISVLLITCGIILCTVISGSEIVGSENS